jgi:hypothetical protein
MTEMWMLGQSDQVRRCYVEEVLRLGWRDEGTSPR